MINENNGAQMWSKMITEQFGVKDSEKLNWVSQYAAIHEIHESSLGVQNGTMIPSQGVSPLYATPLNTVGMANPAAPSPLSTDTTAPGNFYRQSTGSGDVPVSTLPMALNIALMTIGLELVPVIPSKGPWQLLTYMDFPYAGGKLGKSNEVARLDGKGEGRENKPLYFKVKNLNTKGIKGFDKSKLVDGETVFVFTADTYALTGKFKGFGRMDGALLLETVSAVKGSEPASIIDVFDAVNAAAAPTVKIGSADAIDSAEAKPLVKNAFGTYGEVDFVQTQVDFVDGFANFANGKKEAMTRAQNETGTGNVIGLRLFSKWVQMGSYEVTGTVTRQQLQDLPLYGVDAVAKVMEALQNEITQSINARILEHVFALGVTNAVNQREFQGVDLNLHMGSASTSMDKTSVKTYADIMGVEHKTTWGEIKNSEVMTSAENLHTRQRRIASRVLAAATLIQNVGRRGRATWIVTNAQIAAALQDVSGYVVAPFANGMAQDGSQNLYLGGTLMGLKVYVDPYMDWNDTRICVGRKGNGNEPGVIFMPYILADTVSITAEGTMAPKMLVNSRYAIVDAGFYPETMYYTFVVDAPEFNLI